MKRKHLVIAFALLAMLATSAAWGAIGVYKWTASATVPSTIGYMLNMDADDASGAWAVQIAIEPAAGGAPVKTFSYPASDLMAKRGSHSVVWDGSADGGGVAPVGQYKAVITAKAAPVAAGNLKGIFTNAPSQYMSVVVNKNVNSPWFGYIYIAVWHMGIAIVPPDGSSYTVKNFGMTWDGSSPWGIAVDGSDNVWVDNRSGTPNPKKALVFKPDLSGLVGIGPFTFADNDRSICVLGPTNNIYVADIANYTASTVNTTWYGRIATFSGDATTKTTSTAMTDWKSPVGGVGSWCLHAGTLRDEGGAGPVLYVGSREGFENIVGAVCKYNIDWTTGAATLAWANSNLPNSLGVDISPDGSTLMFTRQIATDGQQVWTVPLASAQTATAANCTPLGFIAPPDYEANPPITGYAYTHNMAQLRYDALGNVVATYSHSNFETQGGYWGFFATPDSGSTNTRTTGIIGWSHPQPVIASTNSPVAISSCTPGATGTASVVVTCADGLDKIASVTVDFSSLNKAGQGVVALTGSAGTYTGTFGIGSSLRVGDYNCPITVTSTWPSMVPTVGNLVVRVAGATITGTVTNSKTGWPIANAVVTATTGTPPDYTATTNASGVYTLPVVPGSYAVSAVATSYGSQTGGAVSMTLACGDTKTKNLQLDPMDIHTATGGNWYSNIGRAPNTTACMIGSVLRLPQQGTGTQGFNGYYYLSDSVFNSTQQGVRVNNYTGQPTLKEGDLVVVEGNWDSPTGNYQGRFYPSRAPQVVGTGTKEQPTDFFGSYRSNVDHPYGGLYHVYGKVSDVQTAGVNPFGPYFKVDCATSPTDPTVVQVMVRVDTPATSGVDFTNIVKNGAMVHVNGILSQNDTWQADELSVGKASDVFLFSDAVTSISAAKSQADGSMAYFTNAQATVVGSNFVYVESADRSTGLRIEGTLPAAGAGAIGTGDLMDFHGTVHTSAQGEKYISADLVQRSVQGPAASVRPLDAVGMNNRDAGNAKSLGLFIKTWGKVSAVGTDSFTISDGSAAPIKVICGSTMGKPTVGQTVRVRGVASADASGQVLYMRDERVDWTLADATFQALPLPGALRYPRDYLVLGPFKDANSVATAYTDIPGGDSAAIQAEKYRLDHDFIADATGGSLTELTLGKLDPPGLGKAVGTKTWTRSQATGDNAVLAASDHAAGYSDATFYVHIWIWSPTDQSLGGRIGSDDSAKVIMWNDFIAGLGNETGLQYYATDPVKPRGEIWGQDPFTNNLDISAGWNSILVKVENGTSLTGNPAGVDIQFVDPNAMGTGGWGNANGVAGLGYLLDKP